ncbi:MAG: DctP family TRAP transporter solute-binding subunit [Bacillota bacterium]
MKAKRGALVWLTAVWILTLTVGAAAGVASAAEQIRLTLSTPDPTNSPITLTAKYFEQLVEQRSGGRVQIQVYPDGALFGGSPPAAIKQLGAGALDLLALTTSLYAPFDARFNMFTVPFFFRDMIEVAAFTTTDPATQLLRDLERMGIEGLAYWVRPMRKITTSSRPVRSPGDFKGLRFRVPQSPAYVTYFQALGASPAPIAFGELYTALQTRTVDGQENPLGVIWSARFYEVQKYVTMSDHQTDVWILAANKKKWESLPKDVQDILLQAGRDAGLWKLNFETAMEAEYLRRLRDRGMEVIVLSPEQRQAFEKVASSVESKYKELVGGAFYEEAVKALQALRNF